MTTQLKLPIALRDSASFSNFFVGDNDELLASLAHLGQPGANGNLFVHGPPGAGKTHLLQALSRQAIEAGGDALYVPLSQSGVAPALVSELSDASLVCIDDIQQIAGLSDWEEALLELYERLITRLNICCDDSGETAPAYSRYWIRLMRRHGSTSDV